ncbi:hypothetical protein ACG04Q_13570 [Roseateles sp. DXS20W]|uniref:DUF883 domain-containing protein n=1 Tax=Pelomonas lactea TaxID=3299030 RepID=A0ABW7GKX5_9BURK
MATTTTPFPTSSASPATPATAAVDDAATKPSTKAATMAADKGAAAGHAVLDRATQGAHQAIDRAADAAGPAMQRVQDGVQAAGAMLGQRADDLRQLGDEWTASVRATVREHPIAAIATALAVGALIARLSR